MFISDFYSKIHSLTKENPRYSLELQELRFEAGSAYSKSNLKFISLIVPAWGFLWYRNGSKGPLPIFA
jgi:hypothetical protein